MKTKFLFIFLIYPMICSAQYMIKCNDSISFFISQKNDFNCCIKLTGKLKETENPKVILINNYIFQTLMINKQNYITNGHEDIPILTNYMISETQYFTGIYKEKLNLMMIPINITNDKIAVIWYFDIPEKIQSQAQSGETPAIRQISISIVIKDFIFSIGTTQLKDQSYDDLKNFLSKTIMTIDYDLDQLKLNALCK